MKLFLFLLISIFPVIGLSQQQDLEKTGEQFVQITSAPGLNQDDQGAIQKERTTIKGNIKSKKLLKSIVKLNQRKNRINRKRLNSGHLSASTNFSGFFLVFGLLVMLAGFAFLIVAAYTSGWVALLGLAGIIGGFLIMCLFPAIEGGEMSWLGPIVMGFFGAITGGAMMAVWGIVELIKWLVG